MTTTEAALRDALDKLCADGLEKAKSAPNGLRIAILAQTIGSIRAALSQPSPASSTAGEAEQAAWAWLERRSAEHPNDVTAYGTDDMVDAFMAGAASYQRVLATFANDLEMADFPNVGSALNERMCCNGHMCGCRGASVGEYLAHELRSLSPSSGEPASVAVEAWQLVPVKITQAMLDATCCDERDDFNMRHTWKELLYAAPQPPVSLSKPTPVEAGLREALKEAQDHVCMAYCHFDDPSMEATRHQPICDKLRAALSETLPASSSGVPASRSGSRGCAVEPLRVSPVPASIPDVEKEA